MPAQAGIHAKAETSPKWMPACAGMTVDIGWGLTQFHSRFKPYPRQG